MKVRTLIPKRLDPMDDPAHATVIANLVSAGFRLVGPDDLDPVTVERCIGVVAAERAKCRTKASEMEAIGNRSEMLTHMACGGTCVLIAAELRTLTTGGKNGR